MNSRDPPSKILLLIITSLPQSFPLTNDFLFDMFKHYGEIKKILIFERGKTNKAFIEYIDIKHAIQARRDMMGKSLTPQGGRLLIHFSRLKQLNLEVVDNTRGTLYENEQQFNDQQKTFIQKQVTLPNTQITEQPVLKPQPIQIQQLPEFDQNDISNPCEESPTKAIMEAQYKLLDDDYANEVAKSSINQFDEQQILITELLQQKPSRFLKVSNIDERVTPKMLYNLFNRFGNLQCLLWQKQLSQAILQFFNIDHATIAKELLNNILFFNKELRILFYQTEILPVPNANEEYFNGTGTQFKIIPINKILIFSGTSDLLEIQDMVKLVGKIQEIKLEQNCIQITMIDIYEALKVISVFSEYEYKGIKINLTFK